MSSSTDQFVTDFMEGLVHRNPHQPEFHQAVHDVICSVAPWYLDHAEWRKAQILERLTEPDRVISFRVTWETDDGEIRANRAWRVQFNNVLGPYKGGLRFDKSVNESVLKFLGFEQIFKNSLTGMPMGGAKGGANFNPKDKSDREIMRFCHSMMLELQRHIGEDVDVPAGDIGVGAREISFLFGKYMQLRNRWGGVLTGKGLAFGGSAQRTQATGYGCVYFCEAMLGHISESIEGKRVGISGSGNVAIYAAEKALEMGATVVSLSDSSGTIEMPDGITPSILDAVKQTKEANRGRIGEVAEQCEGVTYHEGKPAWQIGCDVYLPCATQNEVDLEAAKTLVEGGTRVVCEGANMPLTTEAVDYLVEKQVLHAPGKAANAGGVAVSGLEISQNALRQRWSASEVDSRLAAIMKDIHARCLTYGEGDGHVNYVKGANIAGLEAVASTMFAYGVL